MPCYSPMRAWRSKTINESGKRSLVFNKDDAQYADLPIEIPCGQCIGCRLERSRQWAVRCVHESQLYDENCFITLTYDDEHLPANGTLVTEDYQKFMKRLRKHFPQKIRFFQCGEYGTVCRNCGKSEMFCKCKTFTPTLGRPHYHACIFNADFNDKIHYRTVNEIPLYTSETLSSLWPFGFSSIGDVTFDSAAYVARYIMKKITGDKKEDHYGDRKPEYTTMSRRPGIGKGWYDKYKLDVYNADFVIINGVKITAPKFYDNQYEIEQPEKFGSIKQARIKSAWKHAKDNTDARLRVKEKVKQSRISLLTRKYEAE